MKRREEMICSKMECRKGMIQSESVSRFNLERTEMNRRTGMILQESDCHAGVKRCDLSSWLESVSVGSSFWFDKT